MQRIILSLITICGLLISIAPTVRAQDFADPAFQDVWNRTDAVVASGRSTTSWLWGPQPLTTDLRERYDDSPGSMRLVQYFDKARMEINDPNADPNDLWYVTNGLLPVELITGMQQIAGNTFEPRQPAQIPAVGDPDNTFPTYADLATVFTREGAGDKLGNPVTGFFNPGGTISGYDVYRNDPATHIAVVEQGHGIPTAFLQYMNMQSDELGRRFVFGHPVSGAYWVQAKVNNSQQLVLFQVFERRILTYTPNNPEAFRVESGNVGRHYLQWRYPVPALQVFPAEGPAGTTFTVRVYGPPLLPALEEATVIVTPPVGPASTSTIVGDIRPITFDVPTTTDSPVGTWSVVVRRTAISPILTTSTQFTVTSP
jgi:hypothetical protein